MWQEDEEALGYRESNIIHLCVTRSPEICVNLVFKHIQILQYDHLLR